jgi:hypothetical protein
MVQTTAACRLADGLRIGRLRYLQCRSCGARFFDDDAMHAIQSARASRSKSRLASQARLRNVKTDRSSKRVQPARS